MGYATYGRRFGKGLTQKQDIIVTCSLAGAAVIIIGAGFMVMRSREKMNNQLISEINQEVCEVLDLKSFNTNHIAVKNLTDHFVISLTGQAENMRNETFNNTVVDYKISDRDFNTLALLSSKKTLDGDTKAFNQKLLKSIKEILTRSEIENITGINLALKQEDEIAFNVSLPVLEEDDAHLSYNLEIMKFEGKNLKHCLLKVTLPLDDDLVQNPYNIYLRSNLANLTILKSEEIQNVTDVEIDEDITTIISKR